MLEVYSDESCSSGHKFLLLGAIVLDFLYREEIRDALERVKARHGTHGEFKWTKVSSAKLEAYTEYVDVFFEMAAARKIFFHSLAVDTHKLNHRRHNKGDKELGFNKFIYQLLASRIGRMYTTGGAMIYCYLDKRATKHSPEELRTIVNNGLSSRWGICHAPYRRLQFLDSKESLALQLNDVLMGGLAAHINGNHQAPGASRAKASLSGYIVERGCAGSPMASTPRGKDDFSVWHINLR